MTKKQTSLYNRYLYSNLTTLEECYARPSTAKQRAYADCRRRFYEMEGHSFAIVGYNSMMFSVAWKFFDEKSGHMCLHYEANKTVMEFPIVFDD